MIVLGVDPGKTTGWCEISVGAKTFAPAMGEQPLDDFLDEWEPARRIVAVACEDFIVGPRTLRTSRERMWSLEGIGYLRAACRQEGIEFVVQAPASVKPLITDAVLKSLGLWRRTTGGHQMDAARHAVYFAARRGLLELP